MKKKLLISFLGSIALIIGLCCFSGSALSEDDTKVLNYWFSQNGLSRIDSSVTANYNNFFCWRESDSYYLYLTDDTLFFSTYASTVDSSAVGYFRKEHQWNNDFLCYKYKDINDTWNLYDTKNGTYLLSQVQFSVFNSYLEYPYLSNENMDIINMNSNSVMVSNYVQDNFTPLKDWYIANTPLENPFEDNSGLFFSTISNTMSTAYNSMINPLFIEFTSIGIVPFLFFFTAISIVIIWFMRSVFFG